MLPTSDFSPGHPILRGLRKPREPQAAEITQPNFRSGSQKNAYIFDQLKTEAELNLLRQIYGALFFQISIYSSRDIRVDNLARVISRDEKKGDRNRYRSKAEALVVRDEDEERVSHGQKIGIIFQKADFIISADEKEDRFAVKRQAERFVNLIFGSNSFSPTRMEYGMFAAQAAALRSLDLSRQVGAAIFRKTGEVASLGTNEVPRGGGGTYWADDDLDAREYKIGSDSNDVRKRELLREVIEIILGKNPNLDESMVESLGNSSFMDALEYGRIVHAEMCAITGAARLGIPLAGATLYCTTFPCHMCTKLIVSAGISKVVFLEPYPKSLTADLHSDSVRIEGYSRGVFAGFPHVEFVPFFGITPRRYRDLFSRKKRKRDGTFRPFQDDAPRPIVPLLAPWYAATEKAIMQSIAKRIT